MALFELKKRSTKEQDRAVAKKTTVKQQTSSRSSVVSIIDAIKSNVESKLGSFKEDYVVLQDREKLANYFDVCRRNGVISIDTETTGLDPLIDKIVGMCVYTPGEKGAYIPINHVSYITGERVHDQLSEDDVKEELQLLLETHPDVVMFNAKFDIRVIRNQLHVKDIYCTWDCYLASRLMNENEGEGNRGLKPLYNKYVLKGKGDAFSFDNLFHGVTFDKVPISCSYLYAAHDAVITYELYEYQKKFMYYDATQPNEARNGMNGVAWVFFNIEMPCVSVVCDMEDTGVALDLQYAQKLCLEYGEKLREKEREFYNICKTFEDKLDEYRAKHRPNCKLEKPVNIASTTQLAIVLYDILHLKIDGEALTKGTGVDVLAKIDHPIAKAILGYREVQKLMSTYIEKLPKCVNPNDGRVHCSFNQYGADTGRFSSSDPNLQNIPSHNKDIRKMFVASPGYVLMSSDYSQQEPKVMTQMCQDPKMIKAYQDGKDLYAEIAALSFNTTYENCLEFRPDGTTNSEGKARRSQAKSILLGVLYGRGVPSIAEQLGTTTEKAQRIKDSVFKGFPAIPKFEEDSLQMAYDYGYVTTLWGRKRRLPALQLEEYEFKWKDDAPRVADVLDFETETDVDTAIPEKRIRYYLRKLRNCRFNEKRSIFEEANKEGIWIVDNGSKIAEARRQCVNARIQGSAADMSKLAMILVGNDARLKELGFRLLIPVHDELIAECPEENMLECKERFAKLMSIAAGSKLTIPINCDVEVTRAWYGEKLDGTAITKKETSTAREFENELVGYANNWVTDAQKNRKNEKRRQRRG